MKLSVALLTPVMDKQAPDVSILGEYFPAMERVRVMTCGEIQELIDSGRGRLAGKFRYVHCSQKQTFELTPGQGVQLWMMSRPPHTLYFPGEACREAMVHAVLLYRGLDDKYCFFDSNFAIAPTLDVMAVANRSGLASVYYRTEQPGLQGVTLNTCQYYCLAFMSFIVHHPHLPTRWLIREFAKKMRPQGDEKAVRITQEIFDEAGIIRDFESAGTPVHAYRPSLVVRREHGRRRPVKRLGVLSNPLKGLTREQARTLLNNNVTVSLVTAKAAGCHGLLPARHHERRNSPIQDPDSLHLNVNRRNTCKQGRCQALSFTCAALGATKPARRPTSHACTHAPRTTTPENTELYSRKNNAVNRAAHIASRRLATLEVLCTKELEPFLNTQAQDRQAPQHEDTIPR